MGCVFCSNASTEGRNIFENDLARAFLTNMPITPGHTLVVPKRCVSNISDMTVEERTALFELAEKIKGALRRTFNAQGFNVAWNEGEVAGQSIPHFHLHIVPRSESDAGVSEYEPRKFLYRPGSRAESPEAELFEVAWRIKSSM